MKVKLVGVDDNTEVLIAVEPPELSGFTLDQFTIEGTTTSSTDYESPLSSDYTGYNINDKSFYYSTISYSTGTVSTQIDESITSSSTYLAIYPVQCGILTV